MFTEFPVASGSAPIYIATGADGNLWFTEAGANKIGRITIAGVITEFPVPSGAYGSLVVIASGPDGNLWFTEQGANKIGRITPSGAITEFPVPNGAGAPWGITSVPDGSMWFTGDSASAVGRIDLGVFSQPTPITMSGSVSDDGLPIGATLSTTWSATGGPSPVPFSNPTATFPDVAGQVNPVTTSATFSAPGSYTLGLTGSDSQLNSRSSATVTVNPPQAPSILSVNPDSGQQGQQNLSVVLTGQFTHWVQGTTTASFGAGITVASLTVNSHTSATAVLNIDPAATAGSRLLTMTTGSEVAYQGSGFTVTAGTPALQSVNPNSSQQGQQNLSVALTGQFTNWVQGTTTASFGTGITGASLTARRAFRPAGEH